MGSHFIWNADPEILHIAGPFGIRWYSLMFLAGFLIGHQVFIRMAQQEGKNVEKIKDPILYYLIIGTILGARLGHCFFYNPEFYLSHPLKIFTVWEGGLASHGGYIGVIVACYIFTHRYKGFSFLWLLDRIAIVGICAGGFIRIGNFFNSEILGKVTDVPWAIVFQKVDALPRHPTQLYESFSYLSLASFLYFLYRKADRKPLAGRILGICLAATCFFRFFIEFYKENQESFEEGMFLNMGQLLSIPYIAFGLILASGLHLKLFRKRPIPRNG